ncbi:MAG: tRNA (adenosine(37)-N6)-threonylcarbamoyltransferase complex ATPase subunit type 1 TsaE [Spirochaetota bacterium]
MSSSPEQTAALGRRIASRLNPGSILLLDGPLGAGKTALAKGIAAGLGVGETVTSPTYTIVSEYRGRLPLYHVDLYRISDEEEYLNLGLEELLYADGVSLVEWPERAGAPIPGATATLSIRILKDGRREICGPATLLSEEGA